MSYRRATQPSRWAREDLITRVLNNLFLSITVLNFLLHLSCLSFIHLIWQLYEENVYKAIYLEVIIWSLSCAIFLHSSWGTPRYIECLHGNYVEKQLMTSTITAYYWHKWLSESLLGICPVYLLTGWLILLSSCILKLQIWLNQRFKNCITKCMYNIVCRLTYCTHNLKINTHTCILFRFFKT